MPVYVCESCGVQFGRRRGYGSNCRFCSRRCVAIAIVAGKNKERFERQCRFCSRKFWITRSRLDIAKFCSRLCQNRWFAANTDRSGNRNPAWSGGIQTYRSKRKSACERCHSQKNLDVHHRNKDRYDNSEENLMTLCRRCHQITDGRAMRRNSKGQFIPLADQPRPSSETEP